MTKYFRIEPDCDDQGNPGYKAFCDTSDSTRKIGEIIFSAESTERNRASTAFATGVSLVECRGDLKKPLGDITFFPWFDMILSDLAFALLGEPVKDFGDFYPVRVAACERKAKARKAIPLTWELFGFKAWTTGTLQDAESHQWPIFVQVESPYRTLIRENVVQMMLDAGLTGFVTIPVNL